MAQESTNKGNTTGFFENGEFIKPGHPRVDTEFVTKLLETLEELARQVKSLREVNK